MINYILQVVLFQVLFLAIYDFFLGKETFFTKNRWYLVTTPILSFLIPLIKIPTFQKAVSQEYIVRLPEIFLSPEKVIKSTFEETTFYESVNYINIIFWVGVVVFSILFLVKLMKIINLIKTNQAEKLSVFRLIFIPNKASAFSFFNYIFLGKEIPVSQQEKIIQHEMVHSKQKHSVDLLFFEFMKIIMWFNPMIYFYQKRITLVHEYISDEVVAKSESKETYIHNLLSNYFHVENMSFVNQFYRTSLIKKRIVMMTKNQSKKINQLKYLLLIPLLASMLFYSSCSNDSSKFFSSEKKQLQTKYRSSNGKLTSFKGKQETYLDEYFGDTPPNEMVKISYDEFTLLEKQEFEEYQLKLKESFKHRPSVLSGMNFSFYRMPNGRNAYATIEKGINFLGKNNEETQKESEDISFTKVEQAPTFPECEDGDKDCFSRKLQEHFSKNFNKKLLK
jgi:beta-lactamase regulating signal transducer with metallopeptidase domain